MSVSHLWLGLLSSLIVMIACISGCLYTFKQQIEDFANRHVVYVSPADETQYPVDSLIKKFEAAYGRAGRIMVPENTDKRSIQISAGERGAALTACYHPGTGEFIGLKTARTDSFFSFILDLHRNLLLGQTGKMIIGVAILIFVYLLFSGLALWFPTKVKQLKKALLIKWNARFYRLNYDLHNVLGFYTMLLLLFIAITGLYVSFHWVKNGIVVGLGGESISISGENPALKARLADSFNSLLQSVSEAQVPAEPVSLAQLIDETNRLYPEKGTTIISFSNDDLKIITTLKYDRNNWLNFYIPNKAEFNQEGKVIKELRYATLPLHKQFMTVAKPLHTGEIMGLGSIIVYFIVTLIGASLPVTGFIIWWKKK